MKTKPIGIRWNGLEPVVEVDDGARTYAYVISIDFFHVASALCSTSTLQAVSRPKGRSFKLSFCQLSSWLKLARFYKVGAYHPIIPGVSMVPDLDLGVQIR